MASRNEKMHGEVERTPRRSATGTTNPNSSGNGADAMERIIQSLGEVANTVGVHCQTLEKHDKRIKALEEGAGGDASPLLERLRASYEGLEKTVTDHDKRIKALEEGAGGDASPLMARLRKSLDELGPRVDAHDKDIKELKERVSKLEGAKPASAASVAPVATPVAPAAPVAPVASVAPAVSTGGMLNFRVSVPYSIGVVFGDASISRG